MEKDRMGEFPDHTIKQAITIMNNKIKDIDCFYAVPHQKDFEMAA